MPQKRKQKVQVVRLTAHGMRKYPWVSQWAGEAEFTASYGTCHFNGLVLIRDRGSKFGGNYVDQATGDAYRVSQSET